jgi:hypothetical protein
MAPEAQAGRTRAVRRLGHWSAAAVLLTILAACSVHPLPDDVTRISTHDVVQQIRCEAARAVKDLSPKFLSLTIAYEFEFTINETNNASADATFTHPFRKGESSSVALSGGVNKKRDAIRNLRVVDTAQDIENSRCGKGDLEKNWVYPISGDVGVYEIVSTFVQLQRADNPQGAEVFTFSDKLFFITFFSGGVAPRITLTPISGKTKVTSAGVDLSASRRDTHKLTIVLTAGARLPGARGAVARLRSAPGTVPTSNNALLSTTIIQTQVDPTQRALLELDRQRLLTLQDRVTNQIVGP